MSDENLFRLLNAHEVADLLRCTPSHVYHLARRGVLPRIRIDGLVRFRIGDIRSICLEGSTPASRGER